MFVYTSIATATDYHAGAGPQWERQSGTRSGILIKQSMQVYLCVYVWERICLHLILLKITVLQVSCNIPEHHSPFCDCWFPEICVVNWSVSVFVCVGVKRDCCSGQSPLLTSPLLSFFSIFTICRESMFNRTMGIYRTPNAFRTLVYVAWMGWQGASLEIVHQCSLLTVACGCVSVRFLL